MSPVLSTYAGAAARAFGWGYSLAVPSDFELIETQTVGAGGSASVTFGSGGTIPQTYKHLQIRLTARTNRSDASYDVFTTTFNSDTGANYSDHYLFGDGNSAYSGGTANRVSIRNYYIAGNTAASNIFGVAVMDILDYANTSKYKTTRALVGFNQNGAGNEYVSLGSGNWRSTSAITSIQLQPVSGTSFNQFSTFSLYGMK